MTTNKEFEKNAGQLAVVKIERDAALAALASIREENQQLRAVAFWNVSQHDVQKSVEEWFRESGMLRSADADSGKGLSLCYLAQQLRADISRVFGGMKIHEQEGGDLGWLFATLQGWSSCWGAWAERADDQQREIDEARVNGRRWEALHEQIDALADSIIANEEAGE